MTELQLDQLYSEARQRHDQFCTNSRTAIRNRTSTLFVLAKDAPHEVIEALHEYIRRVAPHKTYKILNAPDDPGQNWEGTSAIWDRHLAPYQVRRSLRAEVEYQAYRLKRNLRFLVPRRFRPKPNGVIR
jgi:hypothetical protein